MFDRLAPLGAPTFSARTPKTKAETEAYLRRQTTTLTKLKLADLKDSDDKFSPDLCCDLDGEVESFRPTVSMGDHGRRANQKGVAKTVSPGGHVINVLHQDQFPQNFLKVIFVHRPHQAK